MDFNGIVATGSSREVVAQEDFPKEGILVGDTLIVQFRKPLGGELIMTDELDLFSRNASAIRPPAYSLSYFTDTQDSPRPGRRGFRGVVVGLYRKYGIEESAHGPS